MKKKYKRRKSLKKTIQEINLIKNSVPKIIFRAKNLVVTLKNKEQIKRWLELYPEGTYQIN
tara:strand:+ start:119 stop:301 length:183 start_codon:yes stop_codon:yes gene_type:complete